MVIGDFMALVRPMVVAPLALATSRHSTVSRVVPDNEMPMATSPFSQLSGGDQLNVRVEVRRCLQAEQQKLAVRRIGDGIGQPDGKQLHAPALVDRLRDLLELGRRIDLQRLGQALRVDLKHLLQQRAAILGLPGGHARLRQIRASAILNSAKPVSPTRRQNATMAPTLAPQSSFNCAIEEVMTRSGSASTQSAINRSVGLRDARMPLM